MTPEKAKEKLCSQSLSTGANCVADNCSAWRWRRAKETHGFLEAVQKYMTEHESTGRGTFAAASAEVFKKAELFEETEGYCGLSGKPE